MNKCNIIIVYKIMGGANRIWPHHHQNQKNKHTTNEPNYKFKGVLENILYNIIFLCIGQNDNFHSSDHVTYPT